VLARHHVGLVEQDGLPDAPETIEDEAACELAGTEALERDPEIVKLCIAPGNERRTRSCAGRVWVL
jgi:hypothetical protein